MPAFFIDRPIFAWVVAILISFAGLLALPFMPVAQYPDVAPPQVSVRGAYPGAIPEEIYQSVTRLIEEELNGAEGLLYFESSSDATGSIEITATFEPGTNPTEAAIDVQNRIARVEPRLPQAVAQQGLTVEKAGAGFLMLVTLQSEDGSVDAIGLGDYLSRNVVSEIRRIPGVGQAQLFASERAMRIWLDQDKMVGLNITAGDVSAAIQAQNAPVAAGRIGSQPVQNGQQISVGARVKGQLATPDEFGAIVLRANPDGSTVRLRDVARVEIGGESYDVSARLNGKPSASVAVQLAPTGNALATANAVEARMAELSKTFPPGISYTIPYDTTPFVEISIEKVLHTLAEAMILVFLVMYLFLQRIRYTLIPMIVVPIALLGTLGVLLVAGFSINVLTMFGMVLAIGILVDDAIVVVENVERIMAEEGLSPKDATKKAMGQITGAVVGITLVLMSVFVSMAFFPGAVGVIYQQFSLTMIVSIGFSALLALSLTPALCATLLKPMKKGHTHETKGIFGWFNRNFDKLADRYGRSVAGILTRTGRYMAIYGAIVVVLGLMFFRLPSGFLPAEDQGFLIVDTQAPPEASAERLARVTDQIEKHFMADPAVKDVTVVKGFSFSGGGQNVALSFITLKPWDDREATAEEVAERANGALSQISDAEIRVIAPPAIQGLGTSDGFTFRLQDRNGQGIAALTAAKDQLLAAAQNNPALGFVYVEGLPDADQVELVVDREKANAFGVTFADINNAVSTGFGSAYVNDFPNAGRLQRVVVQADPAKRTQAEDLLRVNVRNANGGMVPLSAFATVTWSKAPSQVVGYNGYPSIRIGGSAAPGSSSGDAIAAMEQLAADLPPGFGFEWTGQSLQEIQSGSQAPFLLAISCVLVFLVLAALYESWSIPLSVMLVVPLGLVGSVLAVTLTGMSNDVYFKVGLITIIGLSAKNAILIIEFAKDLRAEGKGLIEATLEAARLRFRPILMTSLAFTLGVVPLAIASGASAESQQAIGTGVMGGMISGTVLAIFLVPVFFVFIAELVQGKRRDRKALPPPQASLHPAE